MERVKVRRHWDCHKHRKELRVSDASTVYHPVKGQLCYWETHHDCNLYYPIKFKDRESAQRWIDEGTIAQIQESAGLLLIGFSTKCFISRS
jgi:hypothetical protein